PPSTSRTCRWSISSSTSAPPPRSRPELRVVALARLLAAIAAAALVAVAGARLSPLFPLVVDPFLLVAVVVARAGRPLPAMLAGTAAGWAADALSGGPFGLHGLADGLVAYGTARAAQQLVVQRKSSLAAV